MGDADAGVLDAHLDQGRPGGRFAGRCRDPDMPAVRELDGVADEVEEDLLEPVFVGVHERQSSRHVIDQLDQLAAQERPRHDEHQVDELVQVDGTPPQLEGAVLHLGIIEDVVDKAGKTKTAAADHRQVVFHLRGHRPGSAVDERFGHADDTHQGRLQLVRCVREELVLQPVGLAQVLDRHLLGAYGVLLGAVLLHLDDVDPVAQSQRKQDELYDRADLQGIRGKGVGRQDRQDLEGVDDPAEKDDQPRAHEITGRPRLPEHAHHADRDDRAECKERKRDLDLHRDGIFQEQLERDGNGRDDRQRDEITVERRVELLRVEKRPGEEDQGDQGNGD